MADNLTVLNSTGATATLRMKDTTGSGGPLANMSVPTDTTGNPMSVLAGATVTSTAQGASVIVISSLSPSHLITPSSAVSITGTVTLSSVAQVTLTSNTVTLSSNPTLAGGTVATVTSMTSGTVAISNGSNIANVVATSSAITSSMPALIVGSLEKMAFGVAQLTLASVSIASSGNNTLVTETSSQTIRVYGLYLISSAANTLTFCAGSTATALSGAMYVQGFTLPVQAEPYFTSSQSFVVNLASPGQMSGMIYYLQS